ncbi:MAG: hypothetical protein ACYTBJ_12975 [Planctomycetota bacterium]|jgi:hypothetical protein
MDKKKMQQKWAVVFAIIVFLSVLVLNKWSRTKDNDAGRQDRIAVKPAKKNKDPNREGRIEVDLAEASVFEKTDERSPFIRGAHGFCQDQPRTGQVRRWPTFKSDKPLYGFMHFSGTFANSQGLPELYFAIDEAAGTGKGYDRLYLDLNGDCDLSNDKGLNRRNNLPEVLKRGWPSEFEQFVFERFKLDFDFSDAGRQSVEMMPLLCIGGDGFRSMRFIATKLRRGTLNLAGKTFDVLLGYSHSIGHSLDEPHTTMQLFDHDKPDTAPQWWGADQLNAMRLIEGQYYSFSATALGGRVFVKPYEGRLGIFEIGAGGRKLSEMGMQGSLRSADHSVAVGDKSEDGWPKAAPSCQLPAADYLPAHLSVTYGRLRVRISENYHTDGKPYRPARQTKVYGIKIRKDKPFVLDFSNKPEVIFPEPARDTRVQVGNEVKVKAVLIDPKLDIMIRGLDDTTRKKTVEYKGPDGETHEIERDLSLDPKVIITRSDGRVAAEGVMPFG